MTFIKFGLMLIAGFLAVYGLLQERKGAAWGRPLAMVAASIALVIALFSMFSSVRGPDIQQIQRSEERFQEIAGEKIGHYLATNFAGRKVLVLGGADAYMASFLQPYLDGFKKGLGDSLEIIEVMRMPASEGEKRIIDHSVDTTMPDDDLYFLTDSDADTANSLNRALRPYLTDVDIIVSLSDLPYDIENLELWRMRNPPKLVILLPGLLGRLKNAIVQEYIIGVVTSNPHYDFNDRTVPRNFDDAFNKRFLFITPENITQIMTEHQNLFPN